MSSLISRSLILSFSRFLNQAITFFSPIILVRLLDVQQFGQYREFLLYAGLLLTIFSFAVSRSLPYFIPKYPEFERLYVTQTVLFQLLSCATAILLIILLGDHIRDASSFDFVLPLILYLFFTSTFSFVEMYFLAKRRSDLVLYYSAARALAKVLTVTISAYFFREVEPVIYSLICVEALRFTLVLSVSFHKKLFRLSGMNKETLKAQLLYFAPLGVGGLIFIVNKDIGKLYISVYMGATYLALYFVGTYLMPVVNIVRDSVTDVIFPEIVGARKDPWQALSIWRRSTMLFCVLLFPIAFVLFFYSTLIVTTLFTDAYAEAANVFRVFTIFIMLRCLDFHLPLRTINKNVHFLAANVLSLIVNIVLVVSLTPWLGLIGPAISLLLANIIQIIYMAERTKRLFDVRFSELLPWGQVGLVFALCAGCVPILMIGELLAIPDVLRSVVFSILYCGCFVVLTIVLGIGDVELLFRRLQRKLSAS